MHIRIMSVLGLGLILIQSSNVWADDAGVLPQGRFRLRFASAYSQASNQFGQDGGTLSYGSSFSRPLDIKTIAALNPRFQPIAKAMAAQGVKSSTVVANLSSSIDTEILTNVFALEYGATDRLSIGFILPIIHGSVSVSSDSSTTPQFSTLKAATSVAAINSVLRDQLGYSNGLNSWDATGFGDLEVGGKYNYYDAHPIKATIKTGARLPTGRKKDQNNLVDFGFGTGTYAVGLYNYIDYYVLGSLSFTLETGYNYEVPNTDYYRVPISNDLLIGPMAHLDRKLGDYYEVGLEGNYTIFHSLTFSPKYRFYQKFADSYSGGPGVDTSTLEYETDQVIHAAEFTVEYSNLSAVRAGRERFPYAVAGFYRQPIWGENTADVRTAGLQLKSYF